MSFSNIVSSEYKHRDLFSQQTLSEKIREIRAGKQRDNHATKPFSIFLYIPSKVT